MIRDLIIMSDKDPKQSNMTTSVKALMDTINSIYVPLMAGDCEIKESLERYSHGLDSLLSQVVGTRAIMFPPSLLTNVDKKRKPSAEQLDEYCAYLVGLAEDVD